MVYILQAAFHAFQSLIILNNPNPDWTQLADLLHEIFIVTKDKFNHTLSVDRQVCHFSMKPFLNVRSLRPEIILSHRN